MRNQFSVNVYDCCGLFDWENLDSFDLVPATVARLRAKYPGKIVQAFNNDRCDYDTNGLTEDERDAIDGVE